MLQSWVDEARLESVYFMLALGDLPESANHPLKTYLLGSYSRPGTCTMDPNPLKGYILTGRKVFQFSG